MGFSQSGYGTELITSYIPLFCILHVFTNVVPGGIDSPSPIVTSLTKAMDGTLVLLGCSKS